MVRWWRSTAGGLLCFYLLCVLVAMLFSLGGSSGERESVDLLARMQGRGYWESLKFSGLIFIALLVAVEFLALSWQQRAGAYDWRDSVASLVIHLLNILSAPLSLLYLFSVLKFAEQFAILEVPDGPLPFLITLLLVEGAYYWYHRLSHEIPLLWSVHHCHHSAQSLNLSIAFRLHPFGRLLSPLVYLPMICVGFKPEYVLVGLSLSLFYQFFLHTRLVPKMGLLERAGFNTPSKHRVHHGVNAYCIDRNYGGMLILWDYVFATYAEERDSVRYGVSTGFYSYNPVVILIRPLRDWLRGEFHRERELHAVQRVVAQSNESVEAPGQQ
jgi:sterol desaturase/sphingolipid hydroxylase (fatty acid hydroxylase superfamily)